MISAKLASGMSSAGKARRALVTLLWGLCLFAYLPPALALDLPVGKDALRGGRDVGSALPAPAPVSATGSFEYAHTEAVLGTNDAHERLSADVAAAFTYARWLAVSLALGGRYDAHRSPSDQGLATSTRLATRHAFDVSPVLALAIAPALRFPAAASMSRGFQAMSPELSALASYRLWGESELSGLVGYRVDGSRKVVSSPASLSAPDLLAASIARYDQLLMGLLFATPLGPLTCTAEWSWDVGVGKHAPGAFESPMRVSIGAQVALPRGAWAGGSFGVSPSARPKLDELVRIEPRLWLGLSAGVTFGAPEPTQSRSEQAPAPPQAEAPAPTPARVLVRVVDARGEPIRSASVRIASPTESAAQAVDAQGRTTFEVPRGSEVVVSASAPEFVSTELTVGAGLDEQSIELTLDRALPEGEIQGRVRSLRGGPLAAHVEVLPNGPAVDCADDGSFRVTVPPGDYTLRISAPGHETQERAAKVERLGVTILVIDLRRAAP